MSDNSQSSFIPKNPVRGSSRPRPVKRLYLISIVATILFISSALASAGIFVYTLSLEGSLRAEQQRLNEQRDSFSQSDLEQVLEFEARLGAAKQILNQQVYLPALFESLEATALQSTTYVGFAYEKIGVNNILVTLESSNPTFNGVLFQREVLAQNEILEGARIEDISLAAPTAKSPVNSVAFTIEHNPNGRLLLVNQNLDSNPSPASNQSIDQTQNQNPNATTEAQSAAQSVEQSNPTEI